MRNSNRITRSSWESESDKTIAACTKKYFRHYYDHEENPCDSVPRLGTEIDERYFSADRTAYLVIQEKSTLHGYVDGFGWSSRRVSQEQEPEP